MKPAKKIVIIFTVLVVLAALAGFALDCVKDANQMLLDSKGENYNKPYFSKESGFYANDFYLQIACEDKNSKIYYTLDGSDPTEKSTEYTEPIFIEDASKHENVYSMRTDTTTAFDREFCRLHSPNKKLPSYAAPDELISKCTVVKAIAVNTDGIASNIMNASYFVQNSVADYHGCKVISITTDPDNLFDYETGIYVTGKRFDDYLSRQCKEWEKWNANYWGRGGDWKRSANIEIFDTNTQCIANTSCTIEVQGNQSRAYNQKGFNIGFTDEDGNTTSIAPGLFGDDYAPVSITLSAGGNNQTTKSNNVLVAETVGQEIKMKDYVPAVLFLDGEYWGFYWICDSYDETWINHYFGVDDDNLLAVKFKGENQIVKAISSKDHKTREQQSKLFEEFQQFVTANDMSDQDNYMQATEMFDLDAYLDYYAVEMYLSNSDWPMRNKEFWRSYKESDDKYSDTKWRPLIYDMDKCMQSKYASTDTLKFVRQKDDIFDALWDNEEFRKQFEERIMYYADNYFTSEHMNSIIDEYSETYIDELERSWKRFYDDTETRDEFSRDMNDRKKFFAERRQYVESWFK